MPISRHRRGSALAALALAASMLAFVPAPAGGATPGLLDRSRLSVFNGNLTVTQNGAVVEDLEIRGSLRIEASNVTVRNVWVYTTGFWTVYVARGSALFENVEIGNASAVGERGIGGGNITVRLADIHHVEDGIKMGSNSVYDNVRVHDLASPNPSPHSDAIQNDGGNSNVIVRNSSLDSRGASGGLGNAAIQIDTSLGSVNNIRIENNFLNGGNYVVFSREEGTNGDPTNVVLIGNRFGRDYRYGLLSVDGTIVTQNNVWADTGLPINGQQGGPPPSTTVPPVTTAPRPSTTLAPTTTAPRPTTTAPPATTAPRPTTTVAPATTAPRPTTTVAPATTAPRPTTTAAPSTTAPRPTTTVAPATTAPRPTTTVAPATTAPRPTTTVAPAAPRPTTTVAPAAPRPTTTAAPVTSVPRPNTTAGPVTAAAPTTAAPVLTGVPGATAPQVTVPVATAAPDQPASVTTVTIPFGAAALPLPESAPVTVPVVRVAPASATGAKVEPPGASFGSPSINPGTITPAELSVPQAREGGIIHRGFVSTVARMMTSDPLIEAGLVTMAFATLAFASRSVLLAMQRQRY